MKITYPNDVFNKNDLIKAILDAVAVATDNPHQNLNKTNQYLLLDFVLHLLNEEEDNA